MKKLCRQCKCLKNFNEFSLKSEKCRKCIKYYNDKRNLQHTINCIHHGVFTQTKYSKNYKECKKCIYSKKIEKEFQLKFVNFDKLFTVIIDPKKPILFICKKHGLCKQTIKNIRSSPKSMGCKKCLSDLKTINQTKKREIKKNKIKCENCKIYKDKNEYIKNRYNKCKICIYNSNGYKLSLKKYHSSNKYKKAYKNILNRNRKDYYNIYYKYCVFCNKLFVHSNSLPKTNHCIEHRSKNASPKQRCKYFKTKYQIIDKNLIFKRDDYRCSYCGVLCVTNPKFSNSGKYITIDHIVPISKGGSHIFSNLTTSCRSCNSKKSNKLNWNAKKFYNRNIQLKLF